MNLHPLNITAASTQGSQQQKGAGPPTAPSLPTPLASQPAQNWEDEQDRISRTPLTWVSVLALPEDTSHPKQPRDTPAGNKRPAGDQPTGQETIMLSSRKTRGVNAGEAGSEAPDILSARWAWPLSQQLKGCPVWKGQARITSIMRKILATFPRPILPTTRTQAACNHYKSSGKQGLRAAETRDQSHKTTAVAEPTHILSQSLTETSTEQAEGSQLTSAARKCLKKQ